MPKLPKFEDWQAPWVKNSTEFNADVAAKLIYDKTKDVEDLKEAHATQVETLTTENTALKAKITEAERAKMTDAEKAAAEKAEIEKKLVDAGDKDLDVARLELALDHGLTKSQAKRLVGKTRDELTADAVELAKDLGLVDAEGNPVEKGGETFESVNRTRARNPLNPEGGGDGATTDAILKAVPRL